ncbi:tetratricopeptide repeat protein [Kovacikia minuta CCNUW1]|uniref:tetratricopeptide repeat protein n=1 Tax=Kovacikia minuta TaxID=2931930 RepID=UPI001CCA6024|nr:tetratricopeptide repeat protein [Kovacikia minuta]UBF27788.1 tetratricopeptide repeat protein [Kovacikia minuta CCNUW1]
MSRVALLIGVSRYPPGLNPLPKVQKDVEVLRRVLKRPEFKCKPVVCLSDRPLTEMQEAIETFFKQCHPDDQVIFLWAGYVFQEADARLYFAAPETKPDEQGNLIKALSIPASFVQEAMNRSPAQQQMLVLDCQFRQTFDHPPATEAPVDLQTQLGGDQRVILTASAWTHHFTEPEDLNTWSYSRYLADGIETGAADMDSNGVLTPEDLHNYVKRKLKVAAPATDAQIYGNEEIARSPFLEVAVQDAAVCYRKILEDLVQHQEAGAIVSTFLAHRNFLDDIKHGLGLPPREAAAIELQTLQPVRDYQQRRQSYEEKVSGTLLGQAVSNPQNRLHLKQIQKTLGLTDSDTAAIDAAPYVVEQKMQREQYQKNLASYEQILLAAMRRQFPLAEGDRHVLQRLEHALQLKTEDVQAVQTRLTAQMQRLGDAPTSLPVSQMETEPPVELDPNSTNLWATPPIDSRRPAAQPNSPPPQVEQFPKVEQPSRDDTVPPHLVKPVSFSSPESQTTPEISNRLPDIAPRPNAPPQPEVPSPGSPAPPAMSPPTKASATKTSARSYTALIIPGVLLAAIVGTLAAMWSSANFPKLLGGGSQPQPNPTNAQPPLQQATSYTKLGITAQGIGDADAAIRYYNEAIDLLSENCKQPTDSTTNATAAAANNSSAECRLLARAYNNRSYSHFWQKDFSRARSDAEQALALEPSLGEARINLANARFKQGDRAGAINDYDQAIQANLSNTLKAGAYNNRGNVHFAENRLQAAIQDYNQAIKLNQEYADAFFNRGLASSSSNPTSAINDFQTAARLYQGKQDFKQADEATRKATELQQKPSNQTPLPPTDNATPKG